MNQLKDYLDVGAWGSDYLMARLYRDYWGLGFCIDDLQNDLLKIADQSYVLEVIRHIEWNVERWATEKGAPDKPDIVSRYSFDPKDDHGPIVHYGSKYWTDEALEMADLAEEIFREEENKALADSVEKGRLETERYALDSPEVREILDDIPDKTIWDDED